MSLLDDRTWSGRIFLGGWTTSARTQGVMEPATGKEIAEIGIGSAADVDTAVSTARDAQRAWAALPYDERAAVLRRAGDLWSEHADEVTDWIVREAGSIQPKGHFETSMAAQECYEAAALASHPYGELLRSHEPRLSLSRRVPVGVVGVIAPFNFPLILSIRAVAPALALGNAVVLKPDPRTAVSGGVTLARVFEEAGLPAGVLSVIPGGVDVGEAVVTHPDVRVIAGSPPWPPSTSSACISSSAATAPCWCSTTSTSRRPPVWGPGGPSSTRGRSA
jgi:benzaldehyde dehydrogenase (NAD)